jgi:Glycosyltransferase family 87
MNKIRTFFALPFFTQRKYIIGLWLVLAFVTGLKQYLIGSYNNYKIFAYVYRHTVQKLPLYVEYPAQYFDSNHYGPFFSIIIGPFAVLPDGVGIVLWNLFNTTLLIFGVFKLPIKEIYKVAIAWIITNEMITALLSVQFNVGLTGLLLLGFVFLEKQKLFYASIAILIGFLVKLYGIVLLAFFFFIKQKFKFIGVFIIVAIAFFFAPLLITDFAFLKMSYNDWFHALIYKSSYNESISNMANISFMGFMKKVFGIQIHVLVAVAFGASMLGLILLRKSQYGSLTYKLLLFSDLLLCLVLFNTNVESPTFIIAFVGIAIWFILVEKSNLNLFLFIFAMILTSFSPTDIFPKFLREQYVQPYALKVLPCIFIWIDITRRLLTHKFNEFSHQDSKALRL